MKEKLAEVKRDNPNLRQPEVMARCGEIWKEYSDKDKAPYIKLHEEDVAYVEKQKKELDKKGYYTLKNGQKSTDLEEKKKRSKGDAKTEKKSKRKSTKKKDDEEVDDEDEDDE